MSGYHQLTPQQKQWAEDQLNRKHKRSAGKRKFGIAIDYKPDMSGLGVYLQLLVPSIKATLGEPHYEEVWRSFPVEIASRVRRDVRGDRLDSYAADYIYMDDGEWDERTG